MTTCNSQCAQSQDCPMRQGYGHRRVRAGQPPDEANVPCMPVTFSDQQLQDWERELARSNRANVLRLFAVLAVVLLAVGTYLIRANRSFL